MLETFERILCLEVIGEWNYVFNSLRIGIEMEVNHDIVFDDW